MQAASLHTLMLSPPRRLPHMGRSWRACSDAWIVAGEIHWSQGNRSRGRARYRRYLQNLGTTVERGPTQSKLAKPTPLGHPWKKLADPPLSGC